MDILHISFHFNTVLVVVVSAGPGIMFTQFSLIQTSVEIINTNRLQKSSTAGAGLYLFIFSVQQNINFSQGQLTIAS